MKRERKERRERMKGSDQRTNGQCGSLCCEEGQRKEKREEKHSTLFLHSVDSVHARIVR